LLVTEFIGGFGRNATGRFSMGLSTQRPPSCYPIWEEITPLGCKRGIKGCTLPCVIVFAGIGHFLICLFVIANFEHSDIQALFLAWTYTELSARHVLEGKKLMPLFFFLFLSVAADFCSVEDHLLRAGIPLLTQQLLLRFGDV